MFDAREARSVREESSMGGRRASGCQKRWGEVLFGGVAGLGVPMLLLGVGRVLGVQGGLAAIGGVAGVLGALVGGGLARRAPSEPGLTEVERPSEEERGAAELESDRKDGWEPRRGPGGRERYWLLQAPTHPA
jgi:hypothetical protein